MDRKKNYYFMMAGFAAFVFLVFYAFSLKSQLQEVKANQGHYAKEIHNLSSVRQSQASGTNRLFLKKFFTYDSTDQRYTNAKSLMTERGFQATYPSGSGLPKSKSSVSSSLTGLMPFEHQENAREAEFLNEFTLQTQYNDVTSSQKIIVRTALLFVKGKGWKVDDIEYIGPLEYVE